MMEQNVPFSPGIRNMPGFLHYTGGRPFIGFCLFFSCIIPLFIREEFSMKNTKSVFLVIGLGRFGQALCRTLAEHGKQIIAVDRSRQSVEEMADVVDLSVQADATDADALAKAGARTADIAIVAIGGNIEASILSTTILKDLEVPFVIARAENTVHARVLAGLGQTGWFSRKKTWVNGWPYCWYIHGCHTSSRFRGLFFTWAKSGLFRKWPARPSRSLISA